MPAGEVMRNRHPVTRSDLVRDVRALGVRPGGVLMVHTRMSAIGWVVGGAETVVLAVLDVLGAAGTLMAYLGWNDGTGGMTENQPWDHGLGPGSPLAKLVEADGQVLLLGTALDRLTILHHAESLVDSPHKRLASHVIPVREGGGVIWRDVCDHDTSTAIGAFPYERAVGDRDPFAVIGQLALDAGCGAAGRVGAAESHLFPARPLVRLGVEWLSREFGS
jgi:aminoglycoside N3'-acetyltransferase